MAAQPTPNSDRDSHVVTRVTKYSGTQYWTITDFSSLPNPTGSCIISNTFYTYDTTREERAQSNADARYTKVSWKLKLYPRGTNENCKDYISLYLEKASNEAIPQRLDIVAQVTVRKHKNTQDLFSWKGDFKMGNRMGWEKFLPRAKDDKILDDFVIMCTICHTGPTITADISSGESSNPTPVARADDTLHSLVMPLYHSETLTDTRVKLSDGTIFKIHKLILAARSPVFMKMFTGDFKEAQKLSVTISDISTPTCKVMIDHMYGKELPEDMNLDSIEQLVYASEKYELDALRADCVGRLVSMINKDNVGRLLVLSDTFRSVTLQEACQQYVNANSPASVDAMKLRYVQYIVPEVNNQLDIVNKLITPDVNENNVDDKHYG